MVVRVRESKRMRCCRFRVCAHGAVEKGRRFGSEVMVSCWCRRPGGLMSAEASAGIWVVEMAANSLADRQRMPDAESLRTLAAVGDVCRSLVGQVGGVGCDDAASYRCSVPSTARHGALLLRRTSCRRAFRAVMAGIATVIIGAGRWPDCSFCCVNGSGYDRDSETRVSVSLGLRL